jgi:bifunctional non-homologous end joining protein LigD
VRALAYSEPGRLRFESRNLRDITAQYPELARMNRALHHHSVLLDGEIVAFEERPPDPPRPSFGRLQRRMHVGSEAQARRLAKDVPVVYVAFDLLHLDGRSLLGEPYAERRRLLAELGLHGPHWQTPEHVPAGQGAALLQASAAQGLEGVVAKRLDCPYEPGRRSGAWRKVKNVRREELVIGGWFPGEGRRRERIGALLVGVREDGGLRYAGRVGTGFTDAELERLGERLRPLERADSPFDAGPRPPRGAIFVDPELAAEIEFVEWTRDGILRAPSYKGLRDDVAPGEVVLEDPRPVGRNAVEVAVEGRRLKLSNLDKVLYPEAGFTKGDVIDYLRRIAPVLLPHLEGRPLTLKRYPNGVEGDHFYEKNCPGHRPDWVPTVAVHSRRKTIEFCVADEVATLVWLGNLADLELHPYLHRGEDTSRPSTLVFDLDPGPPATIVECGRVGLWLEGMFSGLGLESFAKTSGSKGLQVYVPLNGEATYDQTKPFARTVAELLESSEPDLVVSRMTKSLRPGKVLVDWSQNDEHKTTVGVYSLRAKARPTVSTPVTWDEVRACVEAGDPDLLVFDASQVLERVAEHGDLFAPVLSLVQRLPAG